MIIVFKLFMTYLSITFLRIREEAEKYGICKIVPPKEWNPPCKINMNNPKKFPTKLQQVRKYAIDN